MGNDGEYEHVEGTGSADVNEAYSFIVGVAPVRAAVADVAPENKVIRVVLIELCSPPQE